MTLNKTINIPSSTRVIALFALVTLITVLTRLGLQQQGYDSDLQAFVSDALWALLLVIICRRSVVLSVVILPLWVVIYLGDWAFINSMGSMFDYRDLPYLLDLEFLQASIGEHWLWALLLVVGLIVIAGIGLWALFKVTDSIPPITWQSIVLKLILFSLVFSHYQKTRDDWQDSSFPILHIENMLSDAWLNDTSPILLSSQTPLILQPQELGERIVAREDSETEKNVLLIVMEGLAGVYLPQVAALNNEQPAASLLRTGSWVENALLVPNFVTHTRQTNRGLYAMLCGDYPKIRGGNPKPMELLGNDVEAALCLPHILKSKGYETAYYQAADLQFMTKNLVMPFMGFQKVKGRESFPPDKGYDFPTGFTWGASDKRFFEQVLPEIQQLNRNEKPWFATLLTVGTHHPYGVTKEQLSQHADAKFASVAAADEALNNLLNELNKTGVLDNTLVIVTSDEAHGVPNHWLGQNWGLFFALAPDINKHVKTDVYASLDTSNSILDYLGLYPQSKTLLGRSIFREYQSPRHILLGSGAIKLLDTEGKIHSCTRRAFLAKDKFNRECATLKSESGRLFDRTYIPLEDDAGKFKLLSDLLNHSEYRFHQLKEWNVISDKTDQAIDIPRPSQITVDLSVEFQSTEDDTTDNPDEPKLVAELITTEKSKAVLPRVVLPDLRSGESLSMRYIAQLPKPTESILLSLQGLPQDVDGFVIKSYKYSLQALEFGRVYPPSVKIQSSIKRIADTRFQLVTDSEGDMTLRPSEPRKDNPISVPLLQDESSICSSRHFTNEEEEIIRAYMVYYGRFADPSGLFYWSQRLTNNNDHKLVERQFGRSHEYLNQLGDLSFKELAGRVFYQIFDREIDENSQTYYAAQLKNEKLSLASLALEFIAIAGDDDLLLFNNRMKVSRFYATSAERLTHIEISSAQLRALLKSVNNKPETLDLACKKIETLFGKNKSERQADL